MYATILSMVLLTIFWEDIQNVHQTFLFSKSVFWIISYQLKTDYEALQLVYQLLIVHFKFKFISSKHQ